MDSPLSRRQLQVVAEADPGAIARVVERFQNLNIVPRRVVAEFASDEVLHISVEVCGVSDEHLNLIQAKLAQGICILNAYWHRLD